MIHFNKNCKIPQYENTWFIPKKARKKEKNEYRTDGTTGEK